MKLGIIGTGNIGCAIALAAVTRGSAREIVLVNRTRRKRSRPTSVTALRFRRLSISRTEIMTRLPGPAWF
jgi:pyrroline-5-carboxylate reductase